MSRAGIALRALVLLLAALAAASVRGDTPDLRFLTNRESADARLLALENGVKTSFDATLERYAAEIAASPFDVVLRTDRCRFLQRAAVEYEYSSWAAEVFELAEDCVAELEAEFPEHPEARLLSTERLYGDERLARLSELVEAAKPPEWTPAQRARLFALYAQTLSGSDGSRAASFARDALALDPTSDVRLILARDLVAKGEGAEAARVLESAFDRRDPEAVYYTVERMKLLARAGDVDAVLALHDELRAAQSYYNSLEVIDALVSVGEMDRARAELDRYAERAYMSEGKRRRFYFEYEHGSLEQAVEAYEALRDDGWRQDPLGILRLSLQVRDPELRVRPRDWLGLAGFALAVAAIAFVCAVPIALVHYRGLARRARTNAAYPLDGWRLRDARRASFLFVLASLVASYTVGPFDVVIAEEGLWTAEIAGRQWARLAVAESALALVFLMPIALRGRRVEPRWWSNSGVLLRWIVIGIVCAVVLRIPLLSAFAQGGDAVREAFLEAEMWQLLDNVRSEFGLGTTLWLLMVVAPVLEEFLFRGVMLRAFNAHMKFWSANLLQALIFAGVHMDAQAFVYLAVVGLVLGWLTRRSGGLAAPMAMHAVFNGLAAAVAYA